MKSLWPPHVPAEYWVLRQEVGDLHARHAGAGLLVVSKYPELHLHCCTRVAPAGPNECAGHVSTELPVL